uniref:Uncharacterized protein n=1 Tax=Acrobeloides nanus TaxID=290746 RepID=A0A914CUW4_9BILA
MENVQAFEHKPSRTRSTGDLTQRRISFSSDWQPLSKDKDISTSRIPDMETFSGIDGHPSRGGDELAWQLKKEFHLSKYTEHRRSSVLSERQQSPTRDYDSGFSSSAASNVPLTQQKRSSSQLLYPVGSTDNVVSENIPVRRPPEKGVYENKPVPPAVIGLNITKTPPNGKFEKPLTTPQALKDDYSERLMSPPPGRQTPKSILKQQYIYQQQYSDRDQQWEQSSHISRRDAPMHDEPPPLPKTAPPAPAMSSDIRMRPQSTTTELEDAERFYTMQENLRKLRERSKTPQNTPRYPVTSFNGPFFKLEEVTTPSPDSRPRSQSVAPLLSVRESSNENVDNYPDENYYRSEMRYKREHEEYKRDGFNDPQRIKNLSSSEIELGGHRRNYADPNDQNGVVIWPPLDRQSIERNRPASAMAKSILDPDKIGEFQRQQHMEYEAMRQREEKEMRLREKQMRAIQVQQQKLYEQRQQMMREQQSSMLGSPYSIDDRYMPPPPPPPPPQQQYIQTDELIPPPHTRVFETRPISALSGESFPDPRQSAVSPALSNTWKRTYVLGQPRIDSKNEILTSEELLEKERVEIDLLKRREAFIEKPEHQPQIFRTGKRWQPPPEKPYVWPNIRRPISVEPGSQPVSAFSPGPQDTGEYKWEPVIVDPGYKKERKNFTPTHSPPRSPRRGYGTGPLDDVAKRQTKYVIQPSPDGSHRPKPAFKGPRHTPSGGFVPHAPNAVKVVKKRSSQIHDSTSPYALEEAQDVEIIHEKNYHRPGEAPRHRNASGHRESRTPQQIRSRSVTGAREPINDWEKIYDLPPHSSQVTNKDPPPNIDVRKRTQLFEKQAGTIPYQHQHRSAERRVSESPHFTQLTSQNSIAHSNTAVGHKEDSQPNETKHVPQPPARTSVNSASRNAMPNGGTLLRRVHSREQQQPPRPVPRERASTHSAPGYQSSRHGSKQNVSHSSSVHSLGPTSMVPLAPPPPLQMGGYTQHGQQHHPPQQQHQTSTSQRRGLNRIMQATAASPVPPSYERAKPYVPPPLPPGYRRAHAQSVQDLPRTPPLNQPGNTRRLVRIVQNAASTHPIDGRGQDSHHEKIQNYHRATPVNVGGPGYTHRSTQSIGPSTHSSAHHASNTMRYHTSEREKYL